MDFKRKNGAGLATDASQPTPTEATVDQQANMLHQLIKEDLEEKRETNTPEPAPEPAPSTGIGGKVLAKSRYLWQLYGGLAVAFLAFYALADYTAYTTAEQRPGQLIFSNTMTQLWTACFRLVFVLGASLGLLRLFWPELFRFFRPDSEGPDMMTTIKYELTSFQRLCVFLLAFFGLCYLFIQLLSVNLPQTISVGR
ncbi:hypothetical protein [Spirosoma pomorum]